LSAESEKGGRLGGVEIVEDERLKEDRKTRRKHVQIIDCG